MLRRESINGELHIGARKKGRRFEAHAWVELDAQVLNDGAEVDQHYARFGAPIAGAVAGSRAARKRDSRTVGEADLQ